MKHIVFQISWVRRRDWHILTSGMFTYTNDERFQVLHSEGSDDWTLQIKYVQKRDNGTYECQVSVTVRLSLNFFIGCWDYALDSEDRVNGETCVTVCIAVSRRIQRGRNHTVRGVW
jgi:hypothetical protein